MSRFSRLRYRLFPSSNNTVTIYQTQDGSTALIYAAARGHIESVRLLVKSGADKDIINIVRALMLTRIR